jgi:large subunit ribosomal protein L24
MSDKKFSRTWKASRKGRKQRKYIFNAPLHLRQKMLSVHLSKQLREKYGKRSIPVKKGDKVKVMCGNFRGKEGNVEKVNMRKRLVQVNGVEVIKKDGSKQPVMMQPSNLMITVLEIKDKKRKDKLEHKLEPAARPIGTSGASASTSGGEGRAASVQKKKKEDKK